MKYCSHCGSELKEKNKFCPNCGASINEKDENKENVTATVVNSNNTVKDKTTIAFVCSVFGALCCTYMAIPGLILSIMSLQDMKNGKIDSKNKWMAILGVILSAIGIIQMIYNLTHIDEATKRINDIIEQYK